MLENTSSPSQTTTSSSTTSVPSSVPQVDQSRLLKKPVEQMTDEELDAFIQLVRSRRTSQQLALENKRVGKREKKESKESTTKRAQLLNSLLAGPEEEESDENGDESNDTDDDDRGSKTD